MPENQAMMVHYFNLTVKKLGMVEATIEDLAIQTRSSREPSFLNLNSVLHRFNVVEELRQILAAA